MKALRQLSERPVSACRLAGRHLEGLHANRRDEAGQHDTGETNQYREQSRHDMSGVSDHRNRW